MNNLVEVTITAGIGNDKNGNALHPQVVALALSWAKMNLCNIAGGVTVHEAVGGWVNPATGEVVSEHSRVFVVLTVAEKVDALKVAAAQLRDQLSQSCVAFVVRPVSEISFI